MDVLLKDGDMVLDHRGMPVRIEGNRELAQQAVIRLAVKRGSLPYDPSFGSRLHQIRRFGSQKQMEQEALAAVREALAPMQKLRVLSAGCQYDAENSRLTVQVQAAAGAVPLALEVAI
ncbi:MAG: hypothetical protein PHU30_06915 [Oscillospiraceae bacterium]|nr:hypothetical protein [Oscillospiraceae bacterium]